MVPRNDVNRSRKRRQNIADLLDHATLYPVVLECIPSDEHKFGARLFRHLDDVFRRLEPLLTDVLTCFTDGPGAHTDLPVGCVKDFHQ